MHSGVVLATEPNLLGALTDMLAELVPGLWARRCGRNDQGRRQRQYHHDGPTYSKHHASPFQ